VQNPQPFIVRIVEPPPAPHLTIFDVFVGSLSLTLVAVLVAAALGAVLAFVLVRWRKTHPPEADHLPPVSPCLPLPSRRPSSPAQ
jgi:ABC-type phosphate transport system permease subunit